MAIRPTGLSVRKTPFPMADTDKIPFGFAAQETFSSASASLVILPAATPASGATVSTVTDAEGATVTVSGLTRGVDYELDVTFTRANTTKWTRTLNISCVA